ncbi:hypothetical protein [Winogradskyella schleiferi]|uniref:hypothetical protein n=1 Tax=Winogradskyella schleiferi TaxID=2686078 RepID=UPI0015BB59C8|nr:hypothetical protein [Winogradskyella schleiferi]
MKTLHHEVKRIMSNDLGKNFNLFKRAVLSLAVLGLICTSCSNNNDTTEPESQLEATLELQRSAEIDQIDSVLGDLVIEAYEEQESGISDRNPQDGTIPACVTITIVAQQGYRQVTLDFGTEGCMVRGHLIRGQIVFDYTRNPEAQQIMINYNLLDFYFDAKNVIASRSILRERSNDNGNPQFTHSLDITVVWPNGAEASREGAKIREWVEGFGTGDFSDNIFEITGNWTAIFINGNSHTYTVLTPLSRPANCAYFVSGTFDVQRTNFGGILDYGDGACDDQATFTFNNGTEIPFTLN